MHVKGLGDERAKSLFHNATRGDAPTKSLRARNRPQFRFQHHALHATSPTSEKPAKTEQ